MKHARMSRNTDVYAPEESTVVEPNYDLSYIDSFPHRRRNWLLLHCTDAIVIPVGSLAELRQILSPLMKVRKSCLRCEGRPSE